MFGCMKAQAIIRVTPSASVGEAVNALLTATDKAQAVRWIEFPAAVLLFVVVPGDQQSGAIYVLDRKTVTWFWVDFEDEEYGGYCVNDFDLLVHEYDFLSLVERPGLLKASAGWLLGPCKRRAAQLDPSLLGGRSGGYVTVGLYEDGLPGEMFIRMAKEGSTVSGLMDSFATAVSLALQYGVPLQVLCHKFSHTRFEPSGWSGNPKIGYAKSLMDYLFRWLELRFMKGEQGILFQLQSPSHPLRETGSVVKALGQVVGLGDAPACQFCGSLMVRNGSCYRCMECGSTSGCS